MKKIVFLILTLLFAHNIYAQTTGYIRNDTIKLTNAAKNTTLIIETASKGHNWYLKDIGNGRTQFVEATIADVKNLQDSLGKKANLTGGNLFTGDQSVNGGNIYINANLNERFIGTSTYGGAIRFYGNFNNYKNRGIQMGLWTNPTPTRTFYPFMSMHLDSVSSEQYTDFAGVLRQNGHQVANDDAVAHLTGDENWAGIKRFLDQIIFPNGNAFAPSLNVSNTNNTQSVGIVSNGVVVRDNAVYTGDVPTLYTNNKVGVYYSPDGGGTTYGRNIHWTDSQPSASPSIATDLYFHYNKALDTVANFSDLTANYLPYNGANKDVISDYSITALRLRTKHTVGQAFAQMDENGEVYVSNANNNTLSLWNGGGSGLPWMSWNINFKRGNLRWDNLSADRDIQLPDDTGTVALKGDLSTFIKKTGDSTLDSLNIKKSVKVFNEGFSIDSISPTVPNGHNGVTFDGTYYYVVATSAIYKYNSSWSLVASNVTPFTGVTNIAHLSSIKYYNGLLYVPASQSGTTSVLPGKMLVYNPSDLSLNSQYPLGAGVGTTGVCFDSTYAYTTSYSQQNKIFKLNPSDFSLVDTITMAGKINGPQGIVLYNDRFYFPANGDVNNGGIYSCKKDGTDLVQNYYEPETAGGLEGGDIYGDQLLVLELTDLLRTGSTTVVKFFKLDSVNNVLAADRMGNGSIGNLKTNQVSINTANGKYAFNLTANNRVKAVFSDYLTNNASYIGVTNGGSNYTSNAFYGFSGWKFTDTTLPGFAVNMSTSTGIGELRVAPAGASVVWKAPLSWDVNGIFPNGDNIFDVGQSSNRYANFYGVNYNGTTFTGTASTTAHTPVVLTPGANYTGSTDGSVWVTTSGSFKMRYGGTTFRTALFNDVSVTSGAYLKGNSDNVSFTLTAPSTSPTSGSTTLITSDAVFKALPVIGSYTSTGSATTTFTVTIGTTQTNSTYKISVTPNTSVAAAPFYVTNKTTTTFDVVYPSGLTGSVGFDWQLFK